MSKPAGWFKRWLQGAQEFFDESDGSAQRTGFSFRAFAHFWLLVGKSFVRNRCPVRASALAYATLLSLIPVLAVVVSVTTGMLKSQGSEPVERMLDQMVKNVAPQLNLVPKEAGAGAATSEGADSRQRVVKEITAYISNIQSGALGVTGMVSLIMVAVLLLSNIETTFNDIWGVTKGRPWISRVVQYWAAITLGPIVFVVAVGLTSGQQFAAADHARLVADSVTNYPALATKLAAQGDPMSRYLWPQLSPSTQNLLRTNDLTAKDGLAPLLTELNKVLHGPLIYDETRFKGLVLSSNTTYWLAKKPQGRGVARLNRALLDDAYPAEIERVKPPTRLSNQLAFFSGKLATVLPLVFLAVGFTMLYRLMPYTQVDWSAALVGGLVGGGLWQGNNLLQVLYVSKVVTYSKIYGSLAVVPIFLFGVYLSWLILLFGAQVAYAYQNRRSYAQARLAEGVHQAGREFIAVRLVTLVAQRFIGGEPPLAVAQLSEQLGVPSRLASQIVQILVKARILVECNSGGSACHPGRPLDQITVQDILHAMRTSQGAELPTREDSTLLRVRQELLKVHQAEAQAATAITLQMLASVAPKTGTLS